MKRLTAFIAGGLLCVAGPALAGTALSDNHPEEAYPNDATRVVAQDSYADLVRQVQESLRAHGYDAGPADGVESSKLQAALAQFQLAQLLPASGGLDQATLLALGLDPAALVSSSGEQPAAAGGTAEPQPPAEPDKR